MTACSSTHPQSDAATNRLLARRTAQALRAKLVGLLGAIGISLTCWAQDPAWKELDAPATPALRTEGLIRLDMPSYTSLSYGVDPASLSLGSDGVIRFVMVARSASGTLNAFYQALRCASGEYKVYARTTRADVWTQVLEPEWKPLDPRQASSHPVLALARQGACDGSNPAADTTAGILQSLRSPRRLSY